MSMSDSIPTGDTPQPDITPAETAAQTPAAPPAPPAPPAAAPEIGSAPAAHPAWQKHIDALPDIPEIRTQVTEAFREQDREAQAAIEKARQNATPQEWAQIVQLAKQANVSPDALVRAYNSQVQIRQDPFAFYNELGAALDREVAAGRLTRPQAQAAKDQQVRSDAAAFADTPDENLTEEQRQIRSLQQRIDSQEQQRLAEQQRIQDAAEEREAQEYATEFESTFHEQVTQFEDLPEDRREVIGFIASDAAAMLDANENLRPAAAVQAAFEKAARLGFVTKKGAIQQAAGAAPIGGGAPGIPGQPVQRFDESTKEGRAAREAAMMAAATAALNM